MISASSFVFSIVLEGLLQMNELDRLSSTAIHAVPSIWKPSFEKKNYFQTDYNPILLWVSGVVTAPIREINLGSVGPLEMGTIMTHQSQPDTRLLKLFTLF